MAEGGLERRVAIVGAGLAGVAAALRLAEAGHVPVLIETSRRLGGRASSFETPDGDAVLDNCQHVVMGCCTNLIDLYDRLDVLDLIQWHETLYWTAGRGAIDRTRAGMLPAPFHLARSMAKMGLLDAASKRAIRRAMWRIIRMRETGRLAWRDRTFAAFLDEQGQTPQAVERFWDVVVTSACNLGVTRVNAAHALQVFRQGFLGNRFSSTMGLAQVPLAELYQFAREPIEAAGGEVRLGTPARAIAFDGRRVTGVVTAGDTVPAACVVSAVPFDRLDKLVSRTMRAADVRLRGLDRLDVSPILGVHLKFDQPVMDLPHLILAGFAVQWLFNKETDEQGRHYVHAVISAADRWMALDHDAIVERVMADVHEALPKTTGIMPVEARCIKEKRATFAAVPGVDALRPSSAAQHARGPGIENLYLAGDWCDTGWPATMEGAVRSGYAAAGAIIGEDLLVEDIPPGIIARWLGL